LLIYHATCKLTEMKVIVCLGNPGTEYELTRHNIGFLLGDFLLDRHENTSKGKKWKAINYDILIGGEKCLLSYPQTYMNLSGQSVKAIQAFYKVRLEDLLILYDDFDIPFETVRFREKGSAGTHNGMKSIVSELGNTAIPRLRIGIGPLPEKWNVSDFVLSKFKESELDLLPAVFKECEEKISNWVKITK